jgi:hypothetical protein
MKLQLNIFIVTMAITSFVFAQNNGLTTLFDFNSKESSGNWFIVNDDVMGGVSRSEVKMHDEGYANFRGVLSSENNGGFASIRAMIEMNSEKEYKGVIIRVRGDGNKYNIRFRTNTGFDSYAYQAKFETEKDNWIEVRVPFAEFKPTYRGMTLENKPRLESKNIEQIGLLIADYQFGQFSLDIEWIKVY